MAAMKPEPGDFDNPWKDALQVFLPQFLAFFFADIHSDVDWTRGYESLDKEFRNRSRLGQNLQIQGL